jgi:hypothetical protein
VNEAAMARWGLLRRKQKNKQTQHKDAKFSRIPKNWIQKSQFNDQFRHLLWFILRCSQYISIYI